MKNLFFIVVLGLATAAICYGASSEEFIAQCLDVHNDERALLGIAGLAWNEDLAQDALYWAKTLAKKNTLKHSQDRVHIGENIARTRSKSDSLQTLLEMWSSEKKYYSHKPYPRCSNSGDSGDVGHYTQMIWQESTEVGCGLATGFGRDYLVCQYKTSGNRRGKYAYDKNTVQPGQPPVVQTPIVQTPVVQTPVVQTPVVQTPVVQTPVVQTPVVPAKEEVSDPFIKQILDLHNAERTILGIPELTWAEDLVGPATSWARTLAAKGSLSHSPNRVHIGENVSYTGTKPNSVARLVEMWTSEKQYYVHRPYPDCEEGGNAGHYTQVIWRDTAEVGCGLASNNGRDFLVCQYRTSGNRNGKYAY